MFLKVNLHQMAAYIILGILIGNVFLGCAQDGLRPLASIEDANNRRVASIQNLHNDKNVRCLQCHQTSLPVFKVGQVDGQEYLQVTNFEKPIARVSKDLAYALDRNCGSCHEEQFRQVMTSRHAKTAEAIASAETPPAPFIFTKNGHFVAGVTCIACHYQKHTFSREPLRLSEACLGCHLKESLLKGHEPKEVNSIPNLCVNCHMNKQILPSGVTVFNHSFQ